MAVANGFGKVVTSGSVFMYDTGDTVNSYLGEPTTNVFIHYGTSGPGSESDNAVNFNIQGTTGFIRLGYGQTFGGYTIQPNDVVYKYNLGSNGCHYHGNTVTIPSGKYATFSFDYYVSPGTTIENGYLANFENYGGSALGGSVSTPNSLTGVWQTVTFTSGPTGGSGTQAMFLYPGGCGGRFGNTGYILYKNPQVEFLPHKTQFTQTSRSVSGSLLPLVGNSTLNLSSVSFDSNAQIIFDGTDDTISSPSDSSNNIAGNITMELVLNRTDGYASAVMHKEVQYTLYIAADGAISYADSSYWSYAAFGFHYAAITPGVYHHIVATKNGSLVTIYVDGNIAISQNFGSAITQTNNNLYIGSYAGNSAYFAGKIPISKIYNRALTAAEVKQNYNKYKTRFNLP